MCYYERIFVEVFMPNNHNSQETKEGLYTRIGLLLAAIVGAYAILGEPVMIVPMILFAVAWIVGAWEIFIQARKRHWHRLHWLCQVGAFVIFGFCVYSAYSIFLVKMNVRFITGGPMTQNNHTFEALRFAAQLTNRGKPTSLTSWKAYLVMANGQKVYGEEQYLDNDGAEIEDANHTKTI